VYRLVKHYDDAEEITLDTFVRCFRSLAKFDASRPFTTWLFTIAHNLAIDHLRKVKVHYELDESITPDRMQNDFAAEYEKKLKMERIEIALSRLAPADRELVILFHREEKSYREISEIVKMPVTTIKVRLHRARKRIAEMIKKEVRKK
jgi:RNA polymerase sigma-70 factor (ECF subfamily)